MCDVPSSRFKVRHSMFNIRLSKFDVPSWVSMFDVLGSIFVVHGSMFDSTFQVHLSMFVVRSFKLQCLRFEI